MKLPWSFVLEQFAADTVNVLTVPYDWIYTAADLYKGVLQ